MIARKKSPLNGVTKQKILEFVQLYLDWSKQQRSRILWTDEIWVSGDSHMKPRVMLRDQLMIVNTRACPKVKSVNYSNLPNEFKIQYPLYIKISFRCLLQSTFVTIYLAVPDLTSSFGVGHGSRPYQYPALRTSTYQPRQYWSWHFQPCQYHHTSLADNQ